MGSQCSIGPILRNMGRFYYLLCNSDDMVVQMEVVQCNSIYGIMFIEQTRILKDNICQAYLVSIAHPEPLKVEEALVWEQIKVLYEGIKYEPWKLRMYKWLIMFPNALEREKQRIADDLEAIGREPI